MSWTTLAQTPLSSDKPLHFQQFLDGLSNSNASSFAQDPYGYIWIGTMGGLNRFDGLEFKIYTQVIEDLSSLPGNRVNDLMVDHQGNLWVATFEHIARYDYETDSFFRLSKRDTSAYPNIDAMSLAECAGGRLWVGTLHGLYWVDHQSGDLVNWREGDFVDFQDRQVHDILIDRDGWWMACQDGLYFTEDVAGYGRIDARYFW